MDELAHAIGMEPAAFRYKNATDMRLRAVIEAATERFGWGKSKGGGGRGFGMMAGFDKGGYVSACVEIRVVNGTVRIERIVQAFECGAVVNPDELKNQIAGASMMGV
jgi:isoquinoline 1-oxidoreductase